LLEKLDKGGFGTVYKAETLLPYLGVKQELALKVI
jgi:hypothetical protein